MVSPCFQAQNFGKTQGRIDHQRSSNLKNLKDSIKLLANPGIFAVILGFLLWIAPFALPQSAEYALSLLAGCTTPLSMFVVGATLAGLPIKGIFFWQRGMDRLLRCAFGSAITGFYSIKTVRPASMAANVTNILVAMPAAAQTGDFAARL